jgi:hypothetical protein
MRTFSPARLLILLQFIVSAAAGCATVKSQVVESNVVISNSDRTELHDSRVTVSARWTSDGIAIEATSRTPCTIITEANIQRTKTRVNEAHGLIAEWVVSSLLLGGGGTLLAARDSFSSEVPSSDEGDDEMSPRGKATAVAVTALASGAVMAGFAIAHSVQSRDETLKQWTVQKEIGRKDTTCQSGPVQNAVVTIYLEGNMVNLTKTDSAGMALVKTDALAMSLGDIICNRDIDKVILYVGGSEVAVDSDKLESYLYDALWEQARGKDTADIYLQHARDCPSSTHAGQARALAEEKEFDSLLSTNTMIGYEKFIERYPRGEYAKKAKAKLAELQWISMGKAPSIPQLLDFASRFEGLDRGLEALRMASLLEWKSIKNSKDLDVLKAFVLRYGSKTKEGTAAIAAVDRIERKNKEREEAAAAREREAAAKLAAGAVKRSKQAGKRSCRGVDMSWRFDTPAFWGNCPSPPGFVATIRNRTYQSKDVKICWLRGDGSIMSETTWVELQSKKSYDSAHCYSDRSLNVRDVWLCYCD